MNYEQALEFIHSRPRIKKVDGYAAMKKLMGYLDNPQDKLKFVHIAGTNGKGSCAKMISNVLAKAGYKTGLNISPFVIDFTERFSINGEYIPKDILCAITQRIEAYQKLIEKEDRFNLVEFEIVTAIGFCYFAQEKCDIVCLEVGLGGRFDSTNIIKDSLVSCIMNISFDHMEFLGDTLEKIAFQKAGIIKNNQKVICYPAMDKSALREIKKVAEEQCSVVVLPDIEKIHWERMSKLKTQLKYENYVINQSFTGRHQSYNAVVVIETAKALRELGLEISDEDIIYGIEASKFPARIEVISFDPLVILDGAHNLDGINALVDVLKENGLYHLTAVWASLSDKEPEKIIEKMKPYVDKLFTVELHGSRAVSRQELADMAKKYIPNVQVQENIQQAIAKAKEQQTDGVLVFGSLYLASEARQFLV